MRGIASNHDYSRTSDYGRCCAHCDGGSDYHSAGSDHYHARRDYDHLAIETERGILLTPYDPDTEEALSIATQVARDYRNALRELARQEFMPRQGPRWMSRLVVDAIQTDMLLTHGGMPGLLDENALESALARPRQRFSYDPEADLAAFAAAYGYGLRNHPYNDGNKRVAFMVMAVFLGLNDHELVAAETDVVTKIVALASGELDEDTLEDWIRRHIRKRSIRGAGEGT